MNRREGSSLWSSSARNFMSSSSMGLSALIIIQRRFVLLNLSILANSPLLASKSSINFTSCVFSYSVYFLSKTKDCKHRISICSFYDCFIVIRLRIHSYIWIFIYSSDGRFAHIKARLATSCNFSFFSKPKRSYSSIKTFWNSRQNTGFLLLVGSITISALASFITCPKSATILNGMISLSIVKSRCLC